MAKVLNTTLPHFVNWFPQMADQFEHILRNNCWSDYQIYLNGQVLNYQNPLHEENSLSAAIAPVAVCVYEHAWALAGQNMQAAGVLLGLLPTILTFTGASKVETGILALRRPLLSMLISAGSPAVHPLRAVDYNAPANILQQWQGSKKHHVPERGSTLEALVMIFQYMVALAAIANILEVGYELSYWAVCSFAPQTTYLPFLYPVLTLALHFVGSEAVRRRVRLVHRCIDGNNTSQQKDVRSSLCHWTSNELHLTGSAGRGAPSPRQKPLLLELQEETYLFLFLNWLMSTGAIFHLVLGTLVFSSILFVSVNDAAVVAVRYVFSALAVRLVLTYELCGLREVTDVEQPVRVPFGRTQGEEETTKQEKGGVIKVNTV